MSAAASILRGKDWDVVSKDEWDIDMCMRWLREEVKWSEKDKVCAGEWLGKFSHPGKHVAASDAKSNLDSISEDAIDELDIALKRLKPPGTF